MGDEEAARPALRRARKARAGRGLTYTTVRTGTRKSPHVAAENRKRIKTTAQHQAILDAIEPGEELTASEIGDRIGEKPPRSPLRTLASRGQLKRNLQNGRYRLP